MLRRAEVANEAFVAVQGVADIMPATASTDQGSAAPLGSSLSVFDEDTMLRVLRRRDLWVSDYDLLHLLDRLCKAIGQPLAQWAVNVNYGKLTREQA